MTRYSVWLLTMSDLLSKLIDSSPQVTRLFLHLNVSLDDFIKSAGKGEKSVRYIFSGGLKFDDFERD